MRSGATCCVEDCAAADAFFDLFAGQEAMFTDRDVNDAVDSIKPCKRLGVDGNAYDCVRQICADAHGVALTCTILN